MASALEKRLMKANDNIVKSSAQSYVAHLRTLKKDYSGMDLSERESLSFLKDKEPIIEILSQYKPTTRKTKLAVIISSLKFLKIGDADLTKFYQKEMKKDIEKTDKFIKKQMKTESMTKNWISFEELTDIVKALTKAVKILDLKNKEKLTLKEFKVLEEAVLLNILYIFPMRNDLHNTAVLTLEEFMELSEGNRKKGNYLVIDGENKWLIINDFKTKKSIGSVKYKIPESLSKLIDIFLKFNKSGWFIVSLRDRSTPLTSNGITKFLNRLFKRVVNKTIGTSLIRHIIISHLRKEEDSLLEKERKNKDIQQRFMHSASMNEEYAKKLDFDPATAFL